MSKSHYCDQSACLRKVFYPHLYCDKHLDKSSTPFIEAEVLAKLNELLPDWQHAKLTKVGFHEQRIATIIKLKDYIIGGSK